MNKPTKSGFFDWETLTVQFGGELSKPHNRFTARAIKVPTYKYQRIERESLGGGWYGAKEINTYEADAVFLIIINDKCIGYMFSPYAQVHHIKSPLLEIDAKTDKQITNYMRLQGFVYEPIKSGNQ